MPSNVKSTQVMWTSNSGDFFSFLELVGLTFKSVVNLRQIDLVLPFIHSFIIHLFMTYCTL